MLNPYTPSWKSTEHRMVTEAVLDLSAVSGSCGGQIIVEECACGEEGSINHWNYNNCEFQWQNGNTVGKDGYDVVEESHYCSMCGIVLAREYTRTPIGGCKASCVGTLKLYKANDTENAVATAEFDVALDYHEGRESLELLENAESCEDGVKVVSDCKDCGIRLNEYVTYGHHKIATTSVDTSSVEGTCGEVFGLMECACGQDKGWYSPIWECTESYDYVVDEDGVEHRLCTRTCNTCSVRLVEDWVYIPLGDCKATLKATYSVFAGDTFVGSFGYESVVDYHAEKEVCELKDGVSCENGVNVTVVCEDCGIQIRQDSYTGHRVYPVAAMDASKAEDTCGEVFRIVECVCGQEKSLSLPNNWNFTESFGYVVDDAGVGHNLQTRTCNTCSVRLEQDRTVTKGENCTGTAIYRYKLYAGDTVVGEFTQERVEAMHDTYVIDGALNDGSLTCADGVTYTRKCRDCDYTQTYMNYSHEGFSVDMIDLSAAGACGGTISMQKCPCGAFCHAEADGLACDTGYSWQDMKHSGYGNMEDNGDSLVGQVEHTCKNCGFVFKFKRIEYPTDENSGTGIVYFCLDGTEYVVEKFSYTKN